MSTTRRPAEMTTVENDLLTAIAALLPASAALRVERDAEMGEWAVWLQAETQGDDDELLGSGEARSEALESALRTVRGWAA